MGAEQQTPDLTIDPGVLLGADSSPKPRWGERAAMIRKMALRYPELSHYQIADRVGCNPTNVDQVLGRFLGKELFTDLEDFQSVKASAVEALQFRTLASITDEDISKASFLQRITGAAIMEDKIRLMRGQPTSIHVHALVDVLDAIAAMREQQGR